MDKLLEYEVNGTILKQFEEKVKSSLSEWLIEDNGLDVDVSIYCTNELGTIIIDCYNEDNLEKIDNLTKKFFEKVGIQYSIFED